MRHLIAILLQNEAGALTRVTGLISSRGYNIESLSVAPTNDPTVSRVTLVTVGSDSVIAQINAQLQKLVDVVAVDDMGEPETPDRQNIEAEEKPAAKPETRDHAVEFGEEHQRD